MAARHLVRVLTMLALLFAPLSMIGEHAAMAMPAAAEASSSHHVVASDQSAHCAEMGGKSQNNDGGSPPTDCLVDCAVACSAIPALGSAMVDQLMMPAMAQPLPLVGRVRGLHPESADPPPRTA
jgi:putative hemolysin